jgi:hypothetical protein
MAIDKKYIVNLHGKEFILFAGLLDVAHNDGLSSVQTDLIQSHDADNKMTAIVTAKVVTSKGTFTGIGDANPENVGNKVIALHCIRMAETRAVARALRFATNIGMTALEEIGGDVAEDATPEQVPDDMTEKQRGMLEGFVESNWLGIEEQDTLRNWLKSPHSKATASKAIDKYIKLRDERTKDLEVS